MSFYATIISGFIFFFRLASSERSDMVEGLPEFLLLTKSRNVHDMSLQRRGFLILKIFPQANPLKLEMIIYVVECPTS